MRTPDGYALIGDHAVIGNLRTAALVARDGTIDWCCLPQFDRPSVFAAILDARKGGSFSVTLRDGAPETQQYRPYTNVVDTSFRRGDSVLVVTDFMPLDGRIASCEDPRTFPEIHRILTCEGGDCVVDVEWSPRPGYAAGLPAVEQLDGVFRASSEAGTFWLGVSAADPGVTVEASSVRLEIRLRDGDEVALVTRAGKEPPPASLPRAQRLLNQTTASWREWIFDRRSRRRWAPAGRIREAVIRSELALKLLTFPETGAICAAVSTSLPEEIGGERNWDYRYSWIRDAAMTVQALMSVGHREEAADFLYWAAEAVRGDEAGNHELHIMYTLEGGHIPDEITLDHLEGHRGSRPVRVGNAAAHQRQHDVYGELMAAAYEYVRRGCKIEPELGAFLSRVADQASLAWRDPDDGIWEVRSGARHFVFSKVMCWVALDRALRLAEYGLVHGNLERWARERDAIREEVLEKGYDESVGAFVQAYGSRALDAANLLIPVMEFLPADDFRVLGTIDRTIENLSSDGFVYRYLTDDGVPGQENAFLICTFWLIDALALAGRVDEAKKLFDRVLEAANHVGLLSEEVVPGTGELLGNFPQGFSHIGLINSALYLHRADNGGMVVDGEDEGDDQPPLGSRSAHRKRWVSRDAPGNA
jgi:GH15 family glucan-1,4-alpha-glucosidase